MPSPELQVAVWREWGRRYGAVPACITSDVIECAVARPPQSRDEAFRLATEQWMYCEDIVSQGTETVEYLVQTLLRAPAWFFWWD